MKSTIFAWTIVSFVTLSCTRSVSNVTIGFGSCNEPEGGTTAILPTLQNSLDTLDYFIWLGDNLYFREQDWQSGEAMQARYEEVFSNETYGALFSRSQHRAVWDDHDAGPNNCDSTFSGIADAMNAFKAFWKPNYPMADARSYYGSEVLADGIVELYYLDNRSFRAPVDSAHATVLGKKQMNWFRQAYLNSKAKVKVVLLGGQLLNTAALFENMALFPEERAELMEIIAQPNSLNLVLTGDRHSGEINRWENAQGVIVEATASPLTARAFPHHKERNLNRVHANTTDTQHFGTLKIKNLTKSEITADIELVDAEGNSIFSWRETKVFK